MPNFVFDWLWQLMMDAAKGGAGGVGAYFLPRLIQRFWGKRNISTAAPQVESPSETPAQRFIRELKEDLEKCKDAMRVDGQD